MKQRTVAVILIALGILCFSPPAYSASDRETVGYLVTTVPVDTATAVTGTGGIPCAVWYPAVGGTTRAVYDFGRFSRIGDACTDARPTSGSQPYPLIIYSHGYSGCPTASAYLCEALARDGFIVAAPDHSDDLKICSLPPAYERKSFIGFRILFSVIGLADRLAAGSYDIEEFRYRFVEIKAAINYLIAQGSDERSPFFNMIDGERIGAVGHSLGGFSVMVAAGARDVGIDFGIDAAVSLSGPGGAVFSESDMRRVTIPVMLMYGSKEAGSREKELGILNQYRCLAGPKFLMGVVGGDHLTFSERRFPDALNPGAPATANDARHRLISSRTAAFFRLYLADNADAPGALAEVDPGLSPFYYSF